ncbi:MAG: hypothetical protein Q8K02_16440, partial [Flavobacterium sp.]|nr:hypothetical protein [Flavobacterium sp.]
ISVFNLERMNNTRLEHLKLLNGLLTWRKVNPLDNVEVQFAMNFFQLSRQEVLDLITDANDFFNNAAKDTAKFALCVRCKFPHLPTI